MMRIAALLNPASHLLRKSPSTINTYSLAIDNFRFLFEAHTVAILPRWSSKRPFFEGNLGVCKDLLPQDLNAFASGRFCYSSAAHDDDSSYSTRTPNLEARMRMKEHRRQALAERANYDVEEEVRRIDLDPKSVHQKGDKDTVQAIIRDVMPVGYFVTMPSGREGYLPALDLGTTGGLALLERLFKVGQEITVRILEVSGGRDILTIRPGKVAEPKPWERARMERQKYQ